MWVIYEKQKKGIQKFKETGDSRYIYQDKLDKACFQHGMAYRDLKELTRIRASDKILSDKAFNIAKNPKYHGFQRGIASTSYKFFDKNISATSARSETLPSRKILVLSTHQGRPPPTSPGRPLEILFDPTGDVTI